MEPVLWKPFDFTNFSIHFICETKVRFICFSFIKQTKYKEMSNQIYMKYSSELKVKLWSTCLTLFLKL